MARGERLDEERLKWLVQEVADGDRMRKEAAVKELYRLLDRWLLNYFWSGRVGKDDLADLVQVTMTKLVTHARSFDGRTAFGWMKAIAHNVMVDHFRKTGDAIPVPLPGDDESALAATQFPGAWDAWQGKGQEPMGPDLDRWSDGQRRSALQACVELHMQEFERAHPLHGDALRKASLEGWSMRQLGEHLGKSETTTCEFVRQCRVKSAEYLKDCLKFLETLRARRQAEGGKGGSS